MKHIITKYCRAGLCTLLAVSAALCVCACGEEEQKTTAAADFSVMAQEQTAPVLDAVDARDFLQLSESERAHAETVGREAADKLAGRVYHGKRAEPIAVTPGDYVPRGLMYHLIRDEIYGSLGGLFVKVDDFERQLQLMNERGFTYLFADEFQHTAGPSVVITLDDGYSDNYDNLLPLLVKYNARATVFVVTDLIGTPEYLTEAQIKEMAASGYIRFGSHTVTHRQMGLITDAQTLREEFDRSQQILEELTGRPVRSLAFPNGSYSDLALEVAADYYDYCYTTKSYYPTASDMEISRYYIARDMGEETFLSCLGY